MREEFAVLRLLILLSAGGFVGSLVIYSCQEAARQREEAKTMMQERARQAEQLRAGSSPATPVPAAPIPPIDQDCETPPASSNSVPESVVTDLSERLRSSRAGPLK